MPKKKEDLMEILSVLKEWLDENPAAPDWYHRDIPDHITDALREVYLHDPIAMRDSIEKTYSSWEFKEIKDDPNDKFGWYVAIHTPYGQVGVYSNAKIFQEMGDSVQQFTRLNKTWYGRLYLRFIFWLSRIRND